jgi:hypothetical protein
MAEFLEFLAYLAGAYAMVAVALGLACWSGRHG